MKRWILCIACFGCLSVEAQNIPSVIQDTTTGTYYSSTLSFSNVTAGHALYAMMYDGDGAGLTLTFTDSQGNTWTTIKSANLASDGDTIAVGCAIAGSSGPDTITIHDGGSPVWGTVYFGIVYEVANTTCTTDVTPVSLDTSGQTACNSGALTTSTGNDFLIGMCGLAISQGSFGAGAGWSNASTVNSDTGIYGIAEVQVAANVGSYTTTSSTYSPAAEEAAIEIAFRATTGGSGGGGTSQTITGSGTTNAVPVFTGTSTVTNSPIWANGGNVGIDTLTPNFPLTVNGTASASAYCINGSNCITSWPSSSGGGNPWTSTVVGIYDNVQGNVGIGTTDPNNALTIVGSTNPLVLSLQNTSSGGHTWGFGSFGTLAGYSTGGFGLADQTAGTWRLYLDASGNVGIGTTTPTQALTVNGNINLTDAAIGAGIYLRSTTTANSGNTNISPTLLYEGLVSGNGSTATPWGLNLGSIPWTWGQDQVTYHGGAHVFRIVNGNADEIEAMRISYGGNVGIGTTSPMAKLDVNGSINISGTGGSITFPDGGGTQSVAWTGVLCGGDYAEAVNVSGEKKSYEPGDVLVLASDANGNVERSNEPYSTMVAGVFATKPGVIGRRQKLVKGADEIPMAMVGIVPTKVSAENGAIRQGDLLVTASIGGYAMKGTDRSRLMGAVIGKAMGSIDAGTGIIEVLVTLQ